MLKALTLNIEKKKVQLFYNRPYRYMYEIEWIFIIMRRSKYYCFLCAGSTLKTETIQLYSETLSQT